MIQLSNETSTTWTESDFLSHLSRRLTMWAYRKQWSSVRPHFHKLNSQFHSTSVLFRNSLVFQVTWRYVIWLNQTIEIRTGNMAASINTPFSAYLSTFWKFDGGEIAKITIFNGLFKLSCTRFKCMTISMGEMFGNFIWFEGKP